MDGLTPRTTAFWMTVTLGAAIILIGIRFLVAPLAGAEGYGVPVEAGSRTAYLWAKGIRDIVSGLVGLAFLLAGWRKPLGVYILLVTLVPAADLIAVLRFGDGSALAPAIHGGTVVFMLALAGLLLRPTAAHTRTTALSG